jgi:CheY-like chemotaxis protein
MTAHPPSVDSVNSEEPRVILVVEDDEILRLIVSDYLRECGFDVLEAGDGTEAVTVLEQPQAHIDIVFSDVHMPGLDGFELARWIGHTRPSVKIVLTSGYATSATDMAADLRHLGPVVAKPYGHAALAEHLRAMQ